MKHGTRKRRRFERETYIDTAGMDHRQARRLVRRVRQGRQAFFFDEFATLGNWELYDLLHQAMRSRTFHFEPWPQGNLPARPWIKHRR